MRRALAAAGVLGAVALSPVATQAAWADPAPVAPPGVLAADPLEPLSDDQDDDTAKYGLIGLTGMLGLFGYRKITEHRASRSATRSAPPRTTGTTPPSGTARPSGTAPIGDVDDDGSGSRRI